MIIKSGRMVWPAKLHRNPHMSTTETHVSSFKSGDSVVTHINFILVYQEIFTHVGLVDQNLYQELVTCKDNLGDEN